jgi:hypothetical protein
MSRRPRAAPVKRVDQRIAQKMHRNTKKKCHLALSNDLVFDRIHHSEEQLL